MAVTAVLAQVLAVTGVGLFFFCSSQEADGVSAALAAQEWAALRLTAQCFIRG